MSRRKYRLLEGTYTHNDEMYQAGDVLASDFELDKMFQNKFEPIVTERIPRDPFDDMTLEELKSEAVERELDTNGPREKLLERLRATLQSA